MRLIDADKLKASLSTCSLLCSPESSGAAAFEIVLEILDDQPTFALPSNDPLTLDELRKVDREPVWLKSLADGYGEWVLFEQVALEGICDFAVIGGTRKYDGGYGKGWLAYRRKPGEGAEA